MDSVYIKTKIFSGENSLSRLESFVNKNIWIICDNFLVKNGSIKEILKVIDNSNKVTLFDDVVPDPPLNVIGKGIAIISQLKPDIVIAYGGGSAIDTAKGIIYFAREKKIVDNIKLIAVPTTSGTGSEVTSATVITDTQEKIKHIIFDDGLLPDEAILDAKLTLTVPANITANTGLDVLTHALEAYVSKGANVYSDALAEKSVELIINSLLKCYFNGKDEISRTKMHQASNLAGIAFNNAGLGINHSIAHQLGGNFHIPHGLANALLLNSVIKFNLSSKTAYSKYAKMAYQTGMVDRNTDEKFAVMVLMEYINEIKRLMNIPRNLRECGIEKETFLNTKQNLIDNALKDGCTSSNPVKPFKEDINKILENIY